MTRNYSDIERERLSSCRNDVILLGNEVIPRAHRFFPTIFAMTNAPMLTNLQTRRIGGIAALLEQRHINPLLSCCQCESGHSQHICISARLARLIDCIASIHHDDHHFHHNFTLIYPARPDIRISNLLRTTGRWVRAIQLCRNTTAGPATAQLSRTPTRSKHR